MRVELLLIDPQMDFCDSAGALSVPGAWADMERVAALIRRLGMGIDAIHVTLDAHHPLHLAHPIAWMDTAGVAPVPFTVITVADVEAGRWMARRPSDRARLATYVRELELGGCDPLCIWPPHCLVGSAGASVVSPVAAALREWAERSLDAVEFIVKGSNHYVEHYSALRAEVPDAEDDTTLLDEDWVWALEGADLILVAGEAGSHCVARTLYDLADTFAEEESLRKVVLLTDAISPVPGFEAKQVACVEALAARGMRCATTVDVLREHG